MTLFAGQQAPTPAERVTALKQSLQDSQKRIRQYEWIETTIINLKGEEKARMQKRAFYGADGKLQKVPIGEALPEEQAASSGRKGGRLKAKIVENKKSDMQEYMERAAALIHQYVPPTAAQIQKVNDAGQLSVALADRGLVRVAMRDYLQPGDQLSADLDGASSALAAVNIATYLDKAADAVVLAVRFGSLPDGTRYNAQTTLDAKAKNIQVVIQNSGHRPLVP
jgi:hypothetical protein